MKRKCLRACMLLAAAGVLGLVSGCVVEPNGTIGFQPIVVAPAPVYVAPQPVVEEPVMVPDSYVELDGEYIGLVGDQYFYLGAGGVWLVCDPVRLERFHGWERDHPDWREHAIRNDRFRKDAHGHIQPMHNGPANHGQPAKQATKKKKDEKKNDEGH